MKLMKQDNLNKNITEKYPYDFDLADDGLCLIEIIASAKSWWQNLKSFKSLLHNDNLALVLDKMEISTSLSNETNARAAWHGNELKGFLKTVLIAIHLKKGKHVLSLTPDQSPYLKSITIKQFEEANILTYVPLDKTAQKGSSRPWLSLVAINLSIKDITILAKADKRGRDDDDIKIIIDGETQKNLEKKSHQDWYWCGKILKGKEKEFKKSVNFNGAMHTFDLWADEAPFLEKIELVLLEDGKTDENSVKKYIYKGIYGNEDYNKFNGAIATATNHWNDEFSKETDPVQEILDPNLVKAMAFQESRVGNDKAAGINIMRVGVTGDASLKTLRGELKEYWIHNGKKILLKYDDAQVSKEEDSIHWGIRWLYHKAQYIGDDGRRHWRTWREAVKKYGPPNEKYSNNVWDIYNRGIDKRSKPPLKLWNIVLLIVLFSFIFYAPGFSAMPIKSAVLAEIPANERAYIKDIEITRYNDFSPLFLAEIIEEDDWWESLKIGLYQYGRIKWLTIATEPLNGSILAARFLRLKGFANPLVEVYGQTHAGHGTIYLYEVENDRLALLFSTFAVDFNPDIRWAPDNHEKYGYGNCGEVFVGGELAADYNDINNDGYPDISLSGRQNIICEKDITVNYPDHIDEIKVASLPVKEVYLWNKRRLNWNLK